MASVTPPSKPWTNNNVSLDMGEDGMWDFTDVDPARLDPGIRRAVEVLISAGIETFESCEGGPAHAFPEPTVKFFGEPPEGFRALSIAAEHELPVLALRRVWHLLDGEPTGPWWEMTFHTTDAAGPARH